MFDEVTCDYALPDAFEARGVLFQTKELGNSLDRYTITSDGRLIAHRVPYEEVPEEERPYYGTPEWSTSSLRQFFGSMRAVPVGDEGIMFHGDVRLYKGFATVDDAPVDIREYIVRFTNGRVEWVRGGSVPRDGRQLTREAMRRVWDEQQVPEGGLRVATPDALFD